MKYSFLTLSTLLLFENFLSPSFKESYSILFPTNIDLNQSGCFEISLNQSSLSDNETIKVNIDDTFTLSDSHGKPNITGSITNNELVFTSADSNPKTVSYQVNDASAGDWTGNLNISIEVETVSTPAQFMNGLSISKKIKKIRPNKITFSHDIIDGTYSSDLSINGDESILLYKTDDNNVIITNMKDEKFLANPSMASFFKNLSTVTTIENIDYIDMSTCTDMSDMFYSCSSLTSIDLSSFDVSNVTNMSRAFSLMNSCTSIGDISNWDVSNVENFSSLFYGAFALSNYGDLGKWNVTNKCTDISYMFALSSFKPGTANSSLFPQTLDLTNWDVSNVTNMEQTFKDTFNLETIDISTWNCNNVTNMNQMFAMEDNANTAILKNIIGIDNLNVTNASKTDMFMKCNKLSKPSWYQ